MYAEALKAIVLLALAAGVQQYIREGRELKMHRHHLADSLHLEGKQREWFKDTTFVQLYNKRLERLNYIKK